MQVHRSLITLLLALSLTLLSCDITQNGTMSISGKVALDPSSPLDAQMVARADVTNGKAAFKIEQLQLGPVSVPSQLSGQLETFLNNALNQNMDQIGLKEIKITNGQI